MSTNNLLKIDDIFKVVLQFDFMNLVYLWICLTASFWWELKQGAEENRRYEEEPSTVWGNNSAQEQANGN